MLEQLTAHTLEAARTLQPCHLPRAALGMAQLQRVADNALWRPSAALWSSYAPEASNPELADPRQVCSADPRQVYSRPQAGLLLHSHD